MNILIIGSGGREHTLSWKVKQSKSCDNLFITPGNAGTAKIGNNVNLDPNNFEEIKIFTIENNIGLVIVGPEEPLVNGIVDYFNTDPDLKETKIFGPSKDGAQLEGSKDFSKNFMFRNDIPCGKSKTFNTENIDEGYKFLETISAPYVLKADGLAAGKGVLILKDLNEAKSELRNMILDRKFGDSSTKVVIEEFLDGIELSCFVLTDGKNYKVLPFAKDYKKIGEGDKGLNTGGMGAVSPVPFLDDKFLSKIQNKIIKPTINGIVEENMKYNGFVFIGLIKVNDEPYVIEYNVRMGDPETEVVFPRLKNDLLELFGSMGTPKFKDIKLNITDNHAATVILVSEGYPESYEKGKTIEGLNDLSEVSVFHAGTKKKSNYFITSGGRVLAITSMGNNFELALKNSYNQINKIKFDGMNYRKDIGFDLL